MHHIHHGGQAVVEERVQHVFEEDVREVVRDEPVIRGFAADVA